MISCSFDVLACWKKDGLGLGRAKCEMDHAEWCGYLSWPIWVLGGQLVGPVLNWRGVFHCQFGSVFRGQLVGSVVSTGVALP